MDAGVEDVRIRSGCVDLTGNKVRLRFRCARCFKLLIRALCLLVADPDRLVSWRSSSFDDLGDGVGLPALLRTRQCWPGCWLAMNGGIGWIADLFDRFMTNPSRLMS